MSKDALATVAVLVLFGCGPDSSQATSRSSGASSTATTRTASASASVAGAAPSASASASAAAPAASGFAAVRAKFPPAPSETGPGVLCSGKTCAAGEFCCMADNGSPPACMKKDGEAACRQTFATIAYCDESSDCTGGQMCCAGLTDNGVLQVCATKARCAESWDRPGASMTPAHEVCARGGACATPGYVCVGQSCRPSASRVACGTSTDCPADKPWCFWDAAAKRGECIERGEWAGEAGVFECDGASDCPGGACCGSGMNMSEQSFCGTVQCTPELAYASRLCRTDADCVLNDGRKVPCSPAPDTLPGIGICSW